MRGADTMTVSNADRARILVHALPYIKNIRAKFSL